MMGRETNIWLSAVGQKRCVAFQPPGSPMSAVAPRATKNGASQRTTLIPYRATRDLSAALQGVGDGHPGV